MSADAQCDQVTNMGRHRRAELRRVNRSAHIEGLQISCEELERPCFPRSQAHCGIARIRDQRRQRLQRHAQSNEAYGRWTGDTDFVLGDDEEAGVAAAQMEFAAALARCALTGEINAEEQVFAGPRGKSRAALTHAGERSREYGGAGKDALCKG